ncbi:MAG: rhodanese-like domain-containing protein [Tenuifilaceae bacterium]|jgi:rhodanese-related sulfurtransferase|nr:rhodanese-like domain-containing protein [Tenuifilaceae bacterium]
MKTHILGITVSVIAALIILAMVGKKIVTSPYSISVEDKTALLVSPDANFSLYNLALAVKTNNPDILLIDIRSAEEYNQGRLPNAVNVPIDKLFDDEYSEYISGRSDKVKVLYANTEAEAIRASALLILQGYNHFKVLSGGYIVARDFVINNQNPAYYHFTDEKMRFNYSQQMPAGGKMNQPAQEIQVIDVLVPRGGC